MVTVSISQARPRPSGAWFRAGGSVARTWAGWSGWRRRCLEHGFRVDFDADLLGDQQPAAIQRHVPVSRVVDELTAAGLAERQPDQADGRSSFAVLTLADRNALRRAGRCTVRPSAAALAPT